MSSAQWQRVKQIVAEALERAQTDRTAYLDAACGDDATIRREVDSLLVSEPGAQALEQLPWADLTNPGSPVPPGREQPGTVTSRPAGDAGPTVCASSIGPYRVAQELGQGGMGAVYLAVRDDDEYRKRVAIKVLRRGMESDDIVRRFRNERQILAAIDHPHIAKLLDGSSTADGRPYFVMEYIEGKPIDEYCDSKRLSIVERLVLFHKVCSAVHFAHQNLVVHRDLKPGNILVTPDGTPKLLDFGIAKLLNPELFSQTVELTRFEVRLMTPEYASPEQVQGDPITTASDVYSMGVLLYELLTGHRPYRFRSRQVNEIARVICEQEPTTPSTVVEKVEELTGSDGATRRITPESVSRTREGTKERLRRRLKGDLDNIVLTAMRKEPQRRYASVEQLSEDIRRYLEGLPVKARKGTWAYKASKFVRRHRIGFTAVVVFVSFLLGFSVVTARERRRAEREAAKARAVVEFLTSTLAAVDPRVALGTEPTVRGLLEEAEKRIDSKHGLPLGEEAAVRRTIAESRYQLGHFKEAEREFGRLLTAPSIYLGEGDPDMVDALVGLAATQAELNKLKEAEGHARHAVELLSPVAHRPTERDVRAQNTLARVLLLFGTSDRLKQADEVLTRAADLAGALPPDYPDRIASFELLAQLRLAQERFAEAEPLARENYATARRAFGAYHPATLQALNTLTSCLAALSRYSEALEMQRQHLDDLGRVLGEDHVRTLQARATLGSVLRRMDRFAEAKEVYKDLLSRQTRVLGERHPATLVTRHEMALLQKDLKDAKKAEEMMREVVRLRRETLGATHPETLGSQMMIALTLFEQRRLEDSRDAYAEVLPRIKDALGESSGAYLTGMSNYAGLLYRLGDYSGAERMFRESLAAHRRVYGDQYFGTYYNMMELGTTLVHVQRYAEAEELLLAALNGFRAIFREQPTHRRIRGALGRLVKLYEAWGKPDEVREYRAILESLGEPSRRSSW